MRSHFIGRTAERARFCLILAAPSAAVVYVTGLGGIGKSALLGEFTASAEGAGLAAVHLDLAEVGSQRSGFREAADAALADISGRALLIVDGCPDIEALTTWLHRHWHTDLPADAVVVVADRSSAPLAARIASGWAGTVDLMQLGALSEAESRAVFGTSRVDAAHLSALAQGNPLALTLLAQRTSPIVALEDDVRLVRELIDGIVEPLPSALHRRALQVSALVGHTTEDLTVAVLGEDGHDLFEWLRRQPYMTESEGGLAPDDLVRTLVDADLRWRDRLAYTTLHRRASRHLMTRLDTQLYGLDAVLRTGDELLRLARHRVRTPSGPPGDIIRTVFDDLDEPDLPDEIAEHVRTHGMLREDERVAVTHLCDLAGAPTAVGRAAFEAHHDPLLAWDFVVVPPSDGDLLTLLDLHHVADAVIESRTVGIYGHDWRRLSPAGWLRKLVDQPWDAPIPPPTGVGRRVLTDEGEFSAAVRTALKDLRFDRKLALNPLIDSRMVNETSHELSPEHRLRELIHTTAQSLRETDAALFRIIDRIYLRPSATQQVVAKSMGLPFTTFRRWRNKAVAMIAMRLWDLERGIVER